MFFHPHFYNKKPFERVWKIKLIIANDMKIWYIGAIKKLYNNRLSH